MEEKKDIFDRIMALPGLNVFEALYKKNKELLLYCFFGFATFLISIMSYAFFNVIIELNELIANVFSWIIAVLFAYVTNRTWVFKNTASGVAGIFKEMLLFMTGRVVTLIVEELILLVFISVLHFNSLGVKIIAQVVVIVLNYVISKLVVFKKKIHGYQANNSPTPKSIAT